MTRLADIPDGYVDVPVSLDADKETKTSNFLTHSWGGIDGRCFNCDARPGSTTSHYPCGTTPPRKLVRRGTPAAKKALLASMGAASLDQEEE